MSNHMPLTTSEIHRFDQSTARASADLDEIITAHREHVASHPVGDYCALISLGAAIRSMPDDVKIVLFATAIHRLATEETLAPETP